MSELTNFEKQLAENWENAEQVIYDNEQRITALEAELAAANARADQLAAAAQALSDFPHYPDWVDEFKDEEIKLWSNLRAALAAHHADRPGGLTRDY